MRYIDPHIHMVSRSTDDYERMALAGCVAVTEPAFWAGFDRSSAQGFHDYFTHLTTQEPARAAQYGIDHYCWICLNPKEAEDVGLAREVLAIIPESEATAAILDCLDMQPERPSSRAPPDDPDEFWDEVDTPDHWLPA